MEPLSEQAPLWAGRAAVFDTPSATLREKGRTFVEQIKRGAFARAIAAGGRVTANADHDDAKYLDDTANSLRLFEDERGLRFELQPPDVSYARDLGVLLRTKPGSVRMSFGFSVPRGGDAWSRSADGTLTRTLLDLDLDHIALVTRPAYARTSVEAVRGLRDALQHPEKLLTVPGLSEVAKRDIDEPNTQPTPTDGEAQERLRRAAAAERRVLL